MKFEIVRLTGYFRVIVWSNPPNKALSAEYKSLWKCKLKSAYSVYNFFSSVNSDLQTGWLRAASLWLHLEDTCCCGIFAIKCQILFSLDNLSHWLSPVKRVQQNQYLSLFWQTLKPQLEILNIPKIYKLWNVYFHISCI